jgi:hypothetical protein
LEELRFAAVFFVDLDRKPVPLFCHATSKGYITKYFEKRGKKNRQIDIKIKIYKEGIQKGNTY